MCYCLSQRRDRSLTAEDVLGNEDVLMHRAAFPSAPASKPQPAAAAAAAAAQAPASTMQTCYYIKFPLSYLCFDRLASLTQSMKRVFIYLYYMSH